MSGVARRLASGRAQRGAALIVFATVLILGVAWFTVGALGKASPTDADRNLRTGNALRAAKQALLGYVAQYAARTDFNFPGRFPCPESPNSIGTANEGQAPGACSNTTVEVGRLPWETLGVDPIRDGDGEPLWYVLSPGFRGASGQPLNFGTPALLTLDGAPAVALIIAPGRALNTIATAGTPPAGCSTVNQQSNRYANPLDTAKFIECGDFTTGSVLVAGTSPWSNNRAIAVTAAEWMDAVSGPVADRLQRQVAPALNSWFTTESVANWGLSFLPYASTFGDPTTNDYCGDNGAWEGLPPIAGATAATCSGWSSGNISALLGIVSLPSCNQTGSSMQCSFSGLVLVAGLFSARITVTAPRVMSSFRARISESDIVVAGGASVVPSSFSLTTSPVSGDATLSFDVSQPLVLPLTTSIIVTIPNLPDAAVLADSRFTWFRDNNWQQHTYYAIAPGAMANPTAICSAAGDPGCLIASGLDGQRATRTTNDCCWHLWVDASPRSRLHVCRWRIALKEKMRPRVTARSTRAL